MAAFTETIITGVPGIVLRRSTSRRKAKRKSYDFRVGVEVRFGAHKSRISFEVAALVLSCFGSFRIGPGSSFPTRFCIRIETLVLLKHWEQSCTIHLLLFTKILEALYGREWRTNPICWFAEFRFRHLEVNIISIHFLSLSILFYESCLLNPNFIEYVDLIRCLYDPWL